MRDQAAPSAALELESVLHLLNDVQVSVDFPPMAKLQGFFSSQRLRLVSAQGSNVSAALGFREVNTFLYQHGRHHESPLFSQCC